MPSFRATVAAVIYAAVCVLIARGSAQAQTCSISSSARGPLSCSVTTSVRMTLRMPALVGVTVTSPDDAVRPRGAIVHADIRVKTNRSYALQIASAPVGPADQIARTSGAALPVVWSTPVIQAPLNETPTQLDAYGEPTEDRDPVHVVFARPPRSGIPALDPIRLVLTIVAP
jgi:hypothetical protein